MRWLLPLLLILALLLIPFFQGAPVYGVKDDSEVTPEGLRKTVEGINTFGIELLKRINGKNVVISPASIEFALAIAMEGARGRTLEEMQDVLSLPEENFRRPAFARIYNLLNRKSEVTIELANALWLKPGFRPAGQYLSVIERYYPADVFETISPSKINGWVKERTHGKIDKILNTLPPETVMVITNAIYFYGNWAEEFDPKETRKMPFYTPWGKKQVDMMHDERDVLYYEDENVQAVFLPYKDEDFGMLIILPKSPGQETLPGNYLLADSPQSLNKYLQKFSVQELSKILSSMHQEKVILFIPKFEIDTGILSLKNQLISMGMKSAFSPTDADFSGISEGIWIDNVFHRAYVRVDERGTEAAAATAVVMVKAAVPNRVLFKADHPFLFFIIDKRSGIILFAGKILDPS